MKKINHKTIKILAIESSCDETACSIVEWDNNEPRILSSIVSSQVKLHAAYGGVYPELASREHVRNILPVIQETLLAANSKLKFEIFNETQNSNYLKAKKLKSQEAKKLFSDIDAIAVTIGPGLIGSLLVGVNTAKTLAYTLKKPIYAINHLEGHVYSCFTRENSNNQDTITKQIANLPAGRQDSNPPAGEQNSKPINRLTNQPINPTPQFPLVALVVSGGHTSLVLIKDHFDYKIIGETLDDAAGEAFDKVAKLLDLGYPGGPAISRMANGITNNQTSITKPFEDTQGRQITNKLQLSNKQIRNKLTNQPHYAKATRDKPINQSTFSFPRPMLKENNFDYSFSGLKTAVLYAVNKLKNEETKELKNKKTNNQKTNQPINQLTKQLICHEFQEAVVETLVTKTLRAAQKYKVKSILLCGGVSANSRLQEVFTETLNHKPYNYNFFVPDKKLTGDNAAMIGIAAAYRIALGKKPTPWYDVNADSNLKLN